MIYHGEISRNWVLLVGLDPFSLRLIGILMHGAEGIGMASGE